MTDAVEAAAATASVDKSKTSAPYGLRFNTGKVDLTQLSPVSQILESLVFMYGACKYFKNNWKKFKATKEEAQQEYTESLKRHLMLYERGEWVDEESKMPHLAHLVWNANRIMDVHYYGLNHGKDGKDLYHQPLVEKLPETPTLKNFESIYGRKPQDVQSTT